MQRRFVSSYENKFENSNQLYYHFFGKYIGRLLDIYVHLCLVAYILTMIAGSGATLNQYYGLPTFVGTLGMGLVAALIACLGLRKLIDILGSLGIVIIVAVFSVAAYAFFTSDVSALEGSKKCVTIRRRRKSSSSRNFRRPSSCLFLHSPTQVLSSCAASHGWLPSAS